MPRPDIPEKAEDGTPLMCGTCKHGKPDGFPILCDGKHYERTETACFRWVAFDAKTGGIK